MQCSKCGDPIHPDASFVTRTDILGGKERFHPHCWHNRRKAGVREAPPGTQGFTKSHTPLKSNLLSMPQKGRG